MLVRLRSTVLAWGGAMLLILSATGLVAAASLVGDTTLAPSSTFVDTNGDGIADSCQDAVVADQAAVDAAMLAADLNHDGTISVSEAAQTDWTGGLNCNHGGYVSTVARGSGDDCSAAGTTEGSTQAPAGSTETPDGADEGDQGEGGTDDAIEAPEANAGDCSTDSAEPTTQQTDTPTVCDTTTPEAPTAPAAGEQTPTDTAPNAHGKAVSTVAQDKTAVGGKNCNHGGAVSEAAHQDHGQHGNAEKHAGKHGKGHGKGHQAP
jgi:hypothetical protein